MLLWLPRKNASPAGYVNWRHQSNSPRGRRIPLGLVSGRVGCSQVKNRSLAEKTILKAMQKAGHDAQKDWEARTQRGGFSGRTPDRVYVRGMEGGWQVCPEVTGGTAIQSMTESKLVILCLGDDPCSRESWEDQISLW